MAGLLDFLLQGQGGQGGGLLGFLAQNGQQSGAPMGGGLMGGAPSDAFTLASDGGLGPPQQQQMQQPMMQSPAMLQQQQTAPQMPPQMQQPQGLLDPSVYARQAMPAQHAGIFGGENPLSAIRGALGQISDPEGKQRQQAFQNYIALRGMEDKPAFGQVGEDMFGGKQYGFINAPQQKVTPYTPGAAVGGGNAGVSTGGGADFLAKGVTAVNHELSGNDYIKQFSPEVQQAVKSYVAGESMPTGNPRKGFTQTIKMIAQKYGNDIGVPADDASFSQRRQMLNNLAISTPGSLGGQINFAGTSLEHLASVSEKINDLNNVNGLGIAPLAKLMNNIRQLTTEQAGKANAVTGAAQHYGQEVTKFYSGSPGGEGERSRFMNTLSTAKSPTELADAIQTERDLIPGRLEQLSTQIKTTLGDTAQGRKYQAQIEEAKKAVPRIDASIAKLRGQEPPAAPAAAAPVNISTKDAFDALQSGALFIAADDPKQSIRRKP